MLAAWRWSLLGRAAPVVPDVERLVLPCETGEMLVDGDCHAADRVVDAVSISQLSLAQLDGADVARVDYPVDVTVGLTVDAAAPNQIPVLVGLGEKAGPHFCPLGLMKVDHPGDGSEVVATKRFFMPRSCLYAGFAPQPEPVAGLVRTMNLYARVDPYLPCGHPVTGGLVGAG